MIEIAAASPAATSLPVGSVSQRSAGWWGMLCGIITEAALFAYLLVQLLLFRHPAARRRVAARADGFRARRCPTP